MTAEPSDPITILLPVYGRADLLEPALASVLAQTSSAWRLLIADDGSDEATQRFLEAWTIQNDGEQVQWMRREQNLGLFANLNLAISEAATDWVLLLCSDDLLLPSAVATLLEARHQWPEAGLILSTFDSINADGSPRPADSAWHHDQVSRRTALIPPERFLPALLELGSLNGNLTGMAFSRSLWQQAGPFRDNWRHAADWEWLIRAAETGSVLLSRVPIAQVRTHPAQLSNANRTSGHELQEVTEVVAKLHHHRLLANEPRRHRWAAHVMQFHLWTLLKRLGRGDFEALRPTLGPIHSSAGLMQTGLALLAWFPQRWRRHRKGTSR
ncbi:MAG: glycosyltransferase family 2 protein [Synechococcaceae cyanobacterium ELA445]